MPIHRYLIITFSEHIDSKIIAQSTAEYNASLFLYPKLVVVPDFHETIKEHNHCGDTVMDLHTVSQFL